MKGWKEIFYVNKKKKEVGVAALISNKIDFKTQVIVRDKEGHYIMIKGTIQQKDITLVNIYEPNIGAPKYVKQIWVDIKEEIDRNTFIVEDFNSPLTSKDRSSRQKINKETVALNNIKLNVFNGYLQSISPQSSKIYILFKYTWNIL